MKVLDVNEEETRTKSRTVFLVDTENIGSSWTILLERKTKLDRILLFYTENSPYISYPDMKYICQYPNEFEMVACNTGRNGLDFQLVSYLGYLLKSAPKTRYVIFSNDTGYDPVVQFWCQRGIKLSRISQREIEAKLQASQPKPAAKPDKTKKPSQASADDSKLPAVADDKHQIVTDMVKRQKMPKDKATKVRSILLSEDLNNLADIHNDLVKSFGVEEGSQLYKQLKPDIHKASK
ncbi:MAG: PIN domain-containing protein [Catenisphaera adipataccumulans]|jgi:hypothetical protein|uniref:PIN domain-containing protein n=1 Tax=Catenisphaera adipataccumulans TaxID=700500 RepID=UPI003D8B0734